jgi:hypothetical protein
MPYESPFKTTRLLVAWACALSCAARTVEAQRTVEIRRAVTPTASIRISGAFAELSIHGWKKDSTVITGSIPSDARFDGGFVAASTPSTGAKYYLETASGVPSGTLDLYVPAGARVWAKSGSAKIDVEGITGGLDLNIIGGSVHVSGNPHELTIESMDGSVTVVGSPSWSRLKTATGDIVLWGSSDDAGLTTVSGTIRVTSGRFERARIETVTGAVLFASEVARGGSLDIDTHSGAIDIIMSPQTSADFDVASVAGTIENTLTNRPAVAGREGRGQEIGFTTGSGGARVYIRTFKGDIRLQPPGKTSFKIF